MSRSAAEIGTALPFCALNSLEVIDLAPDRAECAVTVGPWLEGASALGIPAAVAALADMVLMYAASTRAPKGSMPVTAAMRVDLWSEPPEVGTRLVGRATVEAVEGDVLLVTAGIDDGGSRVATGSIRSMLIPYAVPRPGTGPAAPAVPGPPDAPLEGTRSAGTWGASDGTGPEAVLALPAAQLVGLEMSLAGDGMVELRATPSDHLERSGGVVHGGAIPMLGALASSVLFAAVLPEGVGTRRLDMTTDYLRPTLVDTPVVIRSRSVHRSRRLIKCHSVIMGRDGKPTAHIYETAALSEG